LDLTGRKVGRLTPREPTPERRRGSVVWLCDCDCGRSSRVSAAELARPNPTSSCGCGRVSWNKYKGNHYAAQFAGGMSVAQIAAANGVSRATVYQCIRSRGFVCFAGEWRKVGDKEFIRKSGIAAGKAPSKSIE
jgi:hypothetical protein